MTTQSKILATWSPRYLPHHRLLKMSYISIYPTLQAINQDAQRDVTFKIDFHSIACLFSSPCFQFSLPTILSKLYINLYVCIVLYSFLFLSMNSIFRAFFHSLSKNEIENRDKEKRNF